MSNALLKGLEEDQKKFRPAETAGSMDAGQASELNLTSTQVCAGNGPNKHNVEADTRQQVKGENLELTLIVPLSAMPLDIRIVVGNPQTEPLTKGDSGKQPLRPSGNLFLKEGYTDDMICKALKQSSENVFGAAHKGELRYSVGKTTCKQKIYTDHHLLVCLFFYIHINGLHQSVEFCSGQRSKFHSYCKERLQPEGFIFCAESLFSRTIKELLENNKIGFEAYIKADPKPVINLHKGDKDFLFWYEIYRRVQPCFEHVFEAH